MVKFTVPQDKGQIGIDIALNEVEYGAAVTPVKPFMGYKNFPGFKPGAPVNNVVSVFMRKNPQNLGIYRVQIRLFRGCGQQGKTSEHKYEKQHEEHSFLHGKTSSLISIIYLPFRLLQA
jgi:hypothetical protein